MGNILLLYDTKEKDLARDLKDLLEELGLNIEMIPLSSSRGKTLQEKENHYFDNCDGAIFLVTPGSERGGKSYPSPSVADEMGQAKQRFRENPGKVIYLVDQACAIQAVDQKTYEQFDPKNMRSIVEAITKVIKDLKAAGLFMSEKTNGDKFPNYELVKTQGGATVYRFKGEPKHYACPPCRGKGELQILQDRGRGASFVCPNCKTIFQINPHEPLPSHDDAGWMGA